MLATRGLLFHFLLLSSFVVVLFGVLLSDVSQSWFFFSKSSLFQQWQALSVNLGNQLLDFRPDLDKTSLSDANTHGFKFKNHRESDIDASSFLELEMQELLGADETSKE